MAYKKIFDPHPGQPADDRGVADDSGVADDAGVADDSGDNLPPEADRTPKLGGGDRRDGQVYVYDEAGHIVRAVNVALATGRPLLLLGPSGCGKSTMAQHIARCLGWRYYEEVVTSQTRARDLMWRFDAVSRLSDAQAEKSGANPVRAAYLEPAALWWAFDPSSATIRGTQGDDTQAIKPLTDPSELAGARAVVLLDEIDKADPDTPNNLLVALGSWTFRVEETGTKVEADRAHLPLVVITSNGERQLPDAFIRRCIALKLPEHNDASLLKVAGQHFGTADVDLHKRVAEFMMSMEREDEGISRRRTPSAAEFIDALYACAALAPDGNDWEAVVKLALDKECAEPI